LALATTAEWQQCSFGRSGYQLAVFVLLGHRRPDLTAQFSSLDTPLILCSCFVPSSHFVSCYGHFLSGDGRDMLAAALS
jgi:hypothetical protein